MAVVNSPFRSKFGFESVGFTVDDEGNIFAKSIALVDVDEEIDPELPADLAFTEVAGNFRLSTSISNNPPITVFRTRTVTIDLDLTSLSFNIVTDDKTTFFSTGLIHNSGTSGAGAQGKSDGRLSWTVPVSAPDTLYYANADGTIFGTINIENAPSAFSEVEISGTTAATSSTTGALTVDGGVGIAGDLYIAGSLNIDGVGITSISSPTNLELEAANQIVVKVDGNTVGVVKSTGSALPVVDTTINNTVIGNTTPSTAVFTSAAVTNLPTVANSVTNKQYVDGTAIAFSIAFGL